MQFEALPILRDEVSCTIQHRLGAILLNARRVRIPVEDEHAHRPVARTDIQDGNGCVVGKWEEVADQLEPLGSARVLSLLPPHPLVHVRLRGPIVVVAPRPIASCAASLTRPHLHASRAPPGPHPAATVAPTQRGGQGPARRASAQSVGPFGAGCLSTSVPPRGTLTTPRRAASRISHASRTTDITRAEIETVQSGSRTGR